MTARAEGRRCFPGEGSAGDRHRGRQRALGGGTVAHLALGVPSPGDERPIGTQREVVG